MLYCSCYNPCRDRKIQPRRQTKALCQRNDKNTIEKVHHVNSDRRQNILHAAVTAEKAIVHAIERPIGAFVHAVRDEVDVLFNDSPHDSRSVIASNAQSRREITKWNV